MEFSLKDTIRFVLQIILMTIGRNLVMIEVGHNSWPNVMALLGGELQLPWPLDQVFSSSSDFFPSASPSTNDQYQFPKCCQILDQARSSCYYIDLEHKPLLLEVNSVRGLPEPGFLFWGMSDINEVFSTSKNDLQIGSDKKWWDWPNVRDMKKAANCCDKGKGPEKKSRKKSSLLPCRGGLGG